MKYTITYLDYDPMQLRREETDRNLVAIKEFSKGYDYELLIAKDIHGYSSAVNYGFENGKGDYFVFVASDVFLRYPKWLDKLTIPDTITAWKEVPFSLDGSPMLEFSCLCVPRSVYEKIGGLDEIFNDGYGFEDNDFIERAQKEGILMKGVDVDLRHGNSQTFSTYFGDYSALHDHNRSLFLQKWPKYLK